MSATARPTLLRPEPRSRSPHDPGGVLAGASVISGAPPWERFAPDRTGLVRLRRWRRAHRLWVDVGGLPAGNRAAGIALDALCRPGRGGMRHPAVLCAHIAAESERLRQLATARFFRLDGEPLSPWVIPAAAVAGVTGVTVPLAPVVEPLLFAPATWRGVALGAPVDVRALAPFLSPSLVGVVFVDRTLAKALPGWTGRLRDICREAGVAAHTVRVVAAPP